MIAFSPDEIASLNAYQHCDLVHPYTCRVCDTTLDARQEGWWCPRCERITQTGAHEQTRNWEWRKWVASLTARGVAQ